MLLLLEVSQARTDVCARAHQVARVAEEVNSSVDNIGARRLHTVLERILEEISFEAPEKVITHFQG